MSNFKKENCRLCECGCSKPVSKPNNRFICGHHNRGLKGELSPIFGIKRSLETKKKLSKIRTERFSGENHYLYGKHHSLETRLKISASLMGFNHSEDTRLKMSISHSGPGNIKWIDGRSFKDYGDVWSDLEYLEVIKERDSHQCQCPDHDNSRKYKLLNIHHIDFNKSNSNPYNLISLCVRCHLWFAHKEQKEHYRQIFEEIIKVRYEK